MDYLILFFASFLSATVLPFSSELILVGMLMHGSDPVGCLIAATLGNFMGGASTYALGYWAVHWKKPEQLIKNKRAILWIDKFGVWSALGSWIPIIGDVITLLLGWFRLPVGKTMVLLLIGKFLRYLVLSWYWL